MQIKTYLDVTRESVEARKHNLWFGVSLGNKFFTETNVLKYLRWCLEHTKDRVLILIPDEIHAINIEILDSKSPQAALRKATRLGEEKHFLINRLIDQLPKSQGRMVDLVMWRDVTGSLSYKNRLNACTRFYKENKEFSKTIRQAILDGRPDRASKITSLPKEKLDALAMYVLKEISLCVDGLAYDDALFNVCLYPGLTIIDEIFVGLNRRTKFLPLAQQLDPTHKIGILEAYTT